MPNELWSIWTYFFSLKVQEELKALKSEKNELLQAYNSSQEAQETASEKIQVCNFSFLSTSLRIIYDAGYHQSNDVAVRAEWTCLRLMLAMFNVKGVNVWQKG